MLALGLSWPRFARSPPSAGKYVFSPSAPIGRDGFRRPGINHLLGKKKKQKKANTLSRSLPPPLIDNVGAENK